MVGSRKPEEKTLFKGSSSEEKGKSWGGDGKGENRRKMQILQTIKKTEGVDV